MNSSAGQREIASIFQIAPIRQFHYVVDSMLQELGKYLQPSKILENTDSDLVIHLAEENRAVLTCGHRYARVRGKVPPGKCWQVPQDTTMAFEQLLRVIERFNLEVHPMAVVSLDIARAIRILSRR